MRPCFTQKETLMILNLLLTQGLTTAFQSKQSLYIISQQSSDENCFDVIPDQQGVKRHPNALLTIWY